MSSINDSTTAGNPGWNSQDRDWNHQRRCGGFARWRPLELVAMIVGFMVFWPIGLAILGFKFWQKKSGYGGDLFVFAEERAQAARESCRSWRGAQQAGRRGFGGSGRDPRSTGNTAFDDWRSGELARLEEERRKLEAAEREFADHINELRRARDREQFEEFMRARQNRAPDSGVTAP